MAFKRSAVRSRYSPPTRGTRKRLYIKDLRAFSLPVERGSFSNFVASWYGFGTVRLKNTPAQWFSHHRAGAFLFAQMERNVQHFGGGFIGLPDRVSVDVRRCSGLGVAQAVCNGG